MSGTFGSALGKNLLSRSYAEIEVPAHVTGDSREVVQGGVFVAVRGTSRDGHDFIKDVANRAMYVVGDRDIDLPNYIRTSDSSLALPLLVRESLGRPDEFLKTAGVTGTNGKTSTAYMLRHFLGGSRCGLISTVSRFDGFSTVGSNATTPSCEVFYKALSHMRSADLEYAVSEFSSHALSQNRVAGLKLDAAVFTNLTGDHLDYHHDMESYFAAKRRLFTELLDKDGYAVVNVDDAYGRRLYGELSGRRIISFGTNPDVECRIGGVACGQDGTAFILNLSGSVYRFSTFLLGMHNVMNLTGAILAAHALGMDFGDLEERCRTFSGVPGRLERFDMPNGAVAFVDYAHTDDALVNVLSILRKICRGRLIAVFGAGGDRDRTKRPRMGKAVAGHADYAIVTSDNPRNEDPMDIIREIGSGMTGFGYSVEPDRRTATEKAVSESAPGDMILVAGKGHEDYQEISGAKIHYSDSEVLESIGGRRR
ncbi:MAG: UDP-N-acetylmuramoyl-L-alanyl-D-glutamate--2,6-diaminopimelate ligase [Victivallaceae bacterium]|nr:UDP-N-acetylmuramoyl-L-alanyl-D-glutamate--2,6-diaminopimelate ligase [Victivallaceae bacterium]